MGDVRHGASRTRSSAGEGLHRDTIGATQDHGKTECGRPAGGVYPRWDASRKMQCRTAPGLSKGPSALTLLWDISRLSSCVVQKEKQCKRENWIEQDCTDKAPLRRARRLEVLIPKVEGERVAQCLQREARPKTTGETLTRSADHPTDRHAAAEQQAAIQHRRPRA